MAMLIAWWEPKIGGGAYEVGTFDIPSRAMFFIREQMENGALELGDAIVIRNAQGKIYTRWWKTKDGTEAYEAHNLGMRLKRRGR